MRAQFLKDCYKCHAPGITFVNVHFDDDEQGVSAREIPLCPGLGHVSCPLFHSCQHAWMLLSAMSGKERGSFSADFGSFSNVCGQHRLAAGMACERPYWSALF